MKSSDSVSVMYSGSSPLSCVDGNTVSGGSTSES